MAPIPMVPKLWGPPGLTQQVDIAQGSSARVRIADDDKRVRVADDDKRTSVSYKKKATWGYGSVSPGDADEEWGKRRRSNETKKTTEDVSDMTLEQSIYAYIDKYQMVQRGEGLGITISHLNRNIDHPDKRKGKNSEKHLKEAIRSMSSLEEAKELWKGEAVVKIRKQRTYFSPPRRSDFSPLAQCDEILTEVIFNLQQRRNNCDPQEACIPVQRTHYEELISDLRDAHEALRLSHHEG